MKAMGQGAMIVIHHKAGEIHSPTERDVGGNRCV